MPYAPRFGGTRWRHDPAAHGIFIHGGTCCAGPFYRTQALPNDFGITLPTSNPHGQEISYCPEIETNTRHVTFQRAVDHARKLRDQHPNLKDCPIFACTDLLMDSASSGKTAVQQVA